MKAWMIVAGTLLLGGCGEGNVYDMPVGEVYAKLANLRVAPSNDGPFGRLDTTITGSGGRRVTWSASGTFATRRCEATLVAVEPERTRIDLTCGGASPSSGAAAGLETSYTRKAVIELIDSTLGGRAYDPRRARGSTAAFWPDDVVDHGDIGDAAARALEMDREAQRAAGN